eukprot:6462784-Amphidinium_carterae.3
MQKEGLPTPEKLYELQSFFSPLDPLSADGKRVGAKSSKCIKQLQPYSNHLVGLQASSSSWAEMELDEGWVDENLAKAMLDALSVALAGTTL